MLGNETMTGLLEKTRTRTKAIRIISETSLVSSKGLNCPHFMPQVYLQDIFLCSIEEKDDSMAKRGGLVGQRMENFQHHRAAHCVVTGTWSNQGSWLSSHICVWLKVNYNNLLQNENKIDTMRKIKPDKNNKRTEHVSKTCDEEIFDRLVVRRVTAERPDSHTETSCAPAFCTQSFHSTYVSYILIPFPKKRSCKMWMRTIQTNL